jgi:hypothetical protein
MNYAVIEDGRVTNIIVAESADALPGVTLVEVRDDTAIGDIYEDGEFSKPAPDRAAEIQAEIADIKAFLTSTDWILVKITEYDILGLDAELLKNEYGTILEERNAKRARIDDLEEELAELTPL